jgi:hypothetical protein
MREKYFKHRSPFDFNKDTNDIGRPFFWNKKVEDNHFLNLLYRKSEQQFDELYKYHLQFFLSEYDDATEREFFRYVWEVIQDAIAQLRHKDRYTSSHADNFRNKFHLNRFIEYLQSIDEWNLGRTQAEIIAEKEGQIKILKEQVQRLMDERREAEKLDTDYPINIASGHFLTVVDLFKKIEALKVGDKELVFSQMPITWAKLICRYFQEDGEPIKLDRVRRYYPRDAFNPSGRSSAIPSENQHFNIVPAKRRAS